MCDINQETADDEDRLVVWQRWIAELPKVPGFVYEANVQRPPSKKSDGHRPVAIGSAAHTGSAIESFYEEYAERVTWMSKVGTAATTGDGRTMPMCRARRRQRLRKGLRGE